MTAAPDLRIQLDGEAPPLPGYLQVNERADADVPLVLADGLPFTDRSATVIEGGRGLGSLVLADATARAAGMPARAAARGHTPAGSPRGHRPRHRRPTSDTSPRGWASMR